MKNSKKKVIKSRVIEAHVLFTVPKNRLMRFVMMEDSIEAVILNLQEQHPDDKINRQSILSWKFMTVGDIQKDADLIKELNDAGHVLMAGRKRINLPNSEQNPERSVATGLNQGTKADNQIKQITQLQNQQNT